MFPGQGSQYPHMGKKLMDMYSDSRLILEEASEYLNFNLTNECLSEAKISQSKYLQAMVFVISYAYFKAFQHEYGISPACAVGHSLGEISALACSGAMTFENALRLVAFRGEIMLAVSKECGGGMSAVSDIHTSQVTAVCQEMAQQNNIYCATYNLPNQTVISGNISYLQEAEIRLTEMGARIKRLSVMGPFHSPLMKQASEPFKKHLNDVSMENTKWPVFSTRTTHPYIAPWSINNILVEQLTTPVYWFHTINNIYKCTIRIFVEIGPGHILKNLIKQQYPNCKSYAIDEPQDRRALQEYLGKKNISSGYIYKNPMSTVISEMLRIVISVRHEGVNDIMYEKLVAEPYEKLLHMQQALEAGEVLKKEQFQTAVNLFKSILTEKKAIKETQEDMLKIIYNYVGTDAFEGIR